MTTKATIKQIRNVEHSYSIKREVVGQSFSLYPVVKEPGFFSQWRPIVKLYNEYVIMDYYKPGGLTQSECEQHIKEFNSQVEELKKQSVREVSYLDFNPEKW